MHLEIGIFDVQWQFQAFALDGAGKRRGDVEVESIAEFVTPRGATGFNARRLIASVVPSEAGFSQ